MWREKKIKNIPLKNNQKSHILEMLGEQERTCYGTDVQENIP